MTSDGAPPVLSIKAAAAVLDIDTRQLLDWVRRGYVPGAFQFVAKGKYYIPRETVQELAKKMWKTPDWEAAIDAGP